VKEPLWLQRKWVDALHFQQLKRFGGLYGIRDDGAIQSALSRPIHQWSYEQAQDIAALAAAYGFGLARSHGYSDGNRRIAFMAMAVFLDVNGIDLDAPEPEVVRVMLAAAAGDLTEAELASWVRAHSGLRADDPGLPPDRGIDLVEETGGPHGVAELGAADPRQSRGGYEEAGAGG